MRMGKRSGFTLVELIAVVGILLLLIGAIAASVAGAQRRAKIQQAITEAQQLTDAILAYDNYTPPGESSVLAKKAKGANWLVADESAMAFVLGKERNPNSAQEGNIPVLFNGAVSSQGIIDPWGKPYWYRIMATSVPKQNAQNLGDAAFAIPNINRIPADEVN